MNSILLKSKESAAGNSVSYWKRWRILFFSCRGSIDVKKNQYSCKLLSHLRPSCFSFFEKHFKLLDVLGSCIFSAFRIELEFGVLIVLYSFLFFYLYRRTKKSIAAFGVNPTKNLSISKMLRWELHYFKHQKKEKLKLGKKGPVLGKIGSPIP